MSADENLPHFIVTSGLTRRLVIAEDEEAAKQAFLLDVLRRSLSTGRDAVTVHEASDAERAEFGRRARGAACDGQLELVLEDERRSKRRREAGTKIGKEHA